MTDKELRKLNRKQLLELLLLQAKTNDSLKRKIKDLEKQLRDKEIVIKEAGNIADAALKLNDIFALAQKTADQYVENVKMMASRNGSQNKGSVSTDGMWNPKNPTRYPRTAAKIDKKPSV